MVNAERGWVHLPSTKLKSWSMQNRGQKACFINSCHAYFWMSVQRKVLYSTEYIHIWLYTPVWLVYLVIWTRQFTVGHDNKLSETSFWVLTFNFLIIAWVLTIHEPYFPSLIFLVRNFTSSFLVYCKKLRFFLFR